MFEVGFEIRDMFFDRLAVQNRLDKAEQRELSRIGAFIRRRARSILRRRKRTSAAGEAPSVHSKDNRASLKNILFGYDPTIHGVVIGPVRLNQVNRTDGGGRISVPSLMEFGGRLTIEQEQLKIAIGGRTRKDGGRDRRYKLHQGAWFRRSGRKVPWKRYRSHTAVYQPRPFMNPALDAELEAGTIRDVWVSSLERA
jgi:hypothetical protein